MPVDFNPRPSCQPTGLQHDMSHDFGHISRDGSKCNEIYHSTLECDPMVLSYIHGTWQHTASSVDV